MSCHRCGVAQSSKFCRTCGVKIVRGESCPGCNQEVPIQTSEKVVQAGKEWHKPCWEQSQAVELFCDNCGRKGKQGSKCPGCSNVIS
eukprot:TRINITY_DN354_c0_g1_i2.p1 TRINITY_DN354_c0_g1~~TRINITY_DN354_c0_g1_i2.p1  ORF type:complete len:100 (-),score=17.92 TRINITY_DN354_c0_g1_i2:35-295(-)